MKLGKIFTTILTLFALATSGQGDAIQYRGHVSLGGRILFSLHDTVTNTAAWVAPGEYFRGYRLAGYKQDLSVLRIENPLNRKVEELRMNTSSVVPVEVIGSIESGIYAQVSKYNQRLHRAIREIIPSRSQSEAEQSGIEKIRSQFSEILLSNASRDEINQFIDRNKASMDIDALMETQGSRVVESRNRRNTPGWEKLVDGKWIEVKLSNTSD